MESGVCMTWEEKYNALFEQMGAGISKLQRENAMLKASLERIQAIAYAHECPDDYCQDPQHQAFGRITVDTMNTLHALEDGVR